MPIWTTQISAMARSEAEIAEPADRAEDDRRQIGMDEIVGEPAEPWPGEIEEHGQVRHEDEEGEDQPSGARDRIEEEGDGGEGEALEPQQHPCALVRQHRLPPSRLAHAGHDAAPVREPDYGLSPARAITTRHN